MSRQNWLKGAHVKSDTHTANTLADKIHKKLLTSHIQVHSVYYECLPATTWRYGRVSIVGWIRTEAAGCVGRSGVLSLPWPNSWLLDESGPPWPSWPREGEARGEVGGRVIMECAVFRQRPGLFALGRGRDISGRFRRCAVGRCKRGIWMLWFTFLGCIL